MANGHTLLNELSELLEQRRIEQERRKRQLEAVEIEIAAIELTMRLYRRSHNIPELAEPLDIEELHGKTQIEALKIIAKRNGGQFKVVDARSQLEQAGLLKSRKNPLSILYTLIKRSGQFEKVEPGVYRLIDTIPIATENDVTTQEPEEISISNRLARHPSYNVEAIRSFR